MRRFLRQQPSQYYKKEKKEVLPVDLHPMGLKLREERKKRNLTQEQVAEAIGITPAFVGHIERGERSLSLDTLVAFCRYYSVTIDYLMNDTLISTQNVQMERIQSLLHGKTEEEMEAIIDILNVLVRHI